MTSKIQQSDLRIDDAILCIQCQKCKKLVPTRDVACYLPRHCQCGNDWMPEEDVVIEICVDQL